MTRLMLFLLAIALLAAQISAIPNHYKTLGVDEKATTQEIKQKYRQLARKYHPDKSKGSEKQRERAEKRFMQIAEAYETLSDDTKREEYDMQRKMGASGGAMPHGFGGGFHQRGGGGPQNMNVHVHKASGSGPSMQGFSFGGGFEDIARSMGGGAAKGRGSEDFMDILGSVFGDSGGSQFGFGGFQAPPRQRATNTPPRPQTAGRAKQTKSSKPNASSRTNKGATPNMRGAKSTPKSGNNCRLQCEGVSCQRVCR